MVVARSLPSRAVGKCDRRGVNQFIQSYVALSDNARTGSGIRKPFREVGNGYRSTALRGRPATSVSPAARALGGASRDLPLQREDRVRQADRDKLLLCRGRTTGRLRDRGQ